MATILDQILTDTRERVAQAKRRVPVDDLEARPAFHAPTLSLATALRRAGGPAIIAECKQASPSEGVIRAEYAPTEIAIAYKNNAAAALSVLTEPDHFQGSLDDLATVRATVDLPILRKDFIVDEYQLFEARAYGADAVLLIAAALDPAQLRDLHDAATDLGLSVLVEVHDETEVDTLDLDPIGLLGVNHRDLKTFEIDLSKSARIFARLPERIVRVAESGLHTADDLARLTDHGAEAFLIGTAFMRATDPGRALAALRRETAVALAEQQRLRLAS
ncbi:MAG: indole-3-glycerol phosphate synthase TrpC [Rhodothermaceae bacterium]|nr:indole-3-glycerol phosphate synthase TrpC [Rhodothermaceae bacterium]